MLKAAKAAAKATAEIDEQLQGVKTFAKRELEPKLKRLGERNKTLEQENAALVQDYEESRKLLTLHDEISASARKREWSRVPSTPVRDKTPAPKRKHDEVEE